MQIGAVPLALVEEGMQQALDPQSSQRPQHTFVPSLFTHVLPIFTPK
jgi:hypothetical protein